MRDRADQVLATLSYGTGTPAVGRVLLDGAWDNPNYWLRYALLRKALRLSQGREAVVLGPFRSSESRRTARHFGIGDTPALDGSHPTHEDRRLARALVADTETAQDVLGWALPYGFPAEIAYDALLKWQRSAALDIRDPRLPEMVARSIALLHRADKLVDAGGFDLVVVSHVVGFQYAALAWAAVRRGIPALLLTGDYGVLRFAKLFAADDFFDAVNHPRLEDLARLPGWKADALAECGRSYLVKRLGGKTGDIGGAHAFGRAGGPVDRAQLCAEFGWPPDHPVIAVYAPNWFDYPHYCGMRNFRDFHDWLVTTVASVQGITSVNWLFRAHPLDAWYGGVRMVDLMPTILPPHIRIAPNEWSGEAVMRAVDALVGYHGTSGIEYAASGKPVLLADRGWYHDFGFARWCRSREEYMLELSREWWRETDTVDARRRALIFAGWYFGRPDWQGDFVLRDDSAQAAVYEDLPELVRQHAPAIQREVLTIAEWMAAPSRFYHVYKMAMSGAYVP